MLRFYFQNSTLICYLPLFTVYNLGLHISSTAVLESDCCAYFWSHIPLLSRPLKPVCIFESWILAFYSYSLSDIACKTECAILSPAFVCLGSRAGLLLSQPHLCSARGVHLPPLLTPCVSALTSLLSVLDYNTPSQTT